MADDSTFLKSFYLEHFMKRKFSFVPFSPKCVPFALLERSFLQETTLLKPFNNLRIQDLV